MRTDRKEQKTGPKKTIHLLTAGEELMLDYLVLKIRKKEMVSCYYHDGRYWVPETLNGLNWHFFMWELYEVRLAVKGLIKKGIVETINHDKPKQGRVIWYGLTRERYEEYILKIEEMKL